MFLPAIAGSGAADRLRRCFLGLPGAGGARRDTRPVHRAPLALREIPPDLHPVSTRSAHRFASIDRTQSPIGAVHSVPGSLLLLEFLLNKALIAAVAVLGIAAAGCSSSDAGSPATPSPSGSSLTPAPSTATAAATSASASSPVATPPGKAALAKIVLQQADLPAGWTTSPHESDPSDAAAQAAFLRCAGGRDTQPDRAAKVDSPDFDLDDASVMSSASSFKTQSAVEADVAVLKSAKA
ncbi:MAG TPA: hypothetical protein VFL65_07245, partial [Jatrophihabitans sp.]|nr:hypothetical protein [Jatrophihabitans sp.]